MRALIVDDEAPARNGLRLLLTARAVEVVGECDSGRAAVDAIRRHRPDLLFLDIRMPDLDGFGVLAALEGEPLPATAFVTAFDSHALRAFEANAVDYLVKPFDLVRLDQCLARLTRFAGQAQAADRHAALRAAWQRLHPSAGDHRIPVREGHRLRFVRPEEVHWLEARGNYVALHTGADAPLVRGPLGDLLARLDPTRFVRVSRFAAVNLDRVERAESVSGGLVVQLQNGARAEVSRRHAPGFKRHFRGP
ncbi:MAG TPA: LytTR family DNA-binding domain-containing protein [Gemmatimonadales bacterium]|nr:LytTR family DNA-binding domain-containing protein [Gemmatimonadaceae bacterium]HWA58762.1 LytTR family DNA-binding domain-containing protein [Gemmatimonadales bacterium]